jgi:DNA-binding MarR family transcriptional regulator/N-acetylglutamate synthase-like GNAT family acetyltransferase
MGEAHAEAAVAAIRRFNRFYTRRIGVLHEVHVESPFGLTEARVLFELAQAESTTAAALTRGLGIDAGYLSRILRGFVRAGLLEREASVRDGRQSVLRLTAAGRAAFAAINASSQALVGAMVAPLPPPDRRALVEAMTRIEALLGDAPAQPRAYLLRPHRLGDMGWVIGRHAVRFHEDYGWSAEFEPIVAEIAAKFMRAFNPDRERCWIAELAGERVGSVCLVARSETVAQLRLLLVEPEARGLGIGARLVEECIDFARAKGYRKIALWTQSILTAARHIYERAGFKLVSTEPHRSFGQDLVGETWERAL